MRIAVVVGEVLDPSGIAVNRRAGRLFINRQEYIIHPADRCALEASLLLKDQTGAEVIALPRAPLRADDALRQALCRGVDRALLPVGPEFDGADDAAMASILSTMVRWIGEVELVLTGEATRDTGWSQLAGRLAEALGWPQVLRAWRVQLEGTELHLERSMDGSFENVSCVLPAVVSVASGSNPLRYPRGALLINTYRSHDSVTRWPLQELMPEADLQPLLEYKEMHFPPERERGQRVAGSPSEMAAALVAAIARRLSQQTNVRGAT